MSDEATILWAVSQCLFTPCLSICVKCQMVKPDHVTGLDEQGVGYVIWSVFLHHRIIH